MSRYVTVLAPLSCIKCGREGDFLAFFYENFGKLHCLEYSIGDVVKWEKFDSIRRGGRPSGGMATVEGWAECANCGSELVPRVEIVDDVITKAEIVSLFQPDS